MPIKLFNYLMFRKLLILQHKFQTATKCDAACEASNGNIHIHFLYGAHFVKTYRVYVKNACNNLQTR